MINRSRPASPALFRLSVMSAILMFLAGCATVHEPEYEDPGGPPEISPALQTYSGHELKRKVVIARFSNETAYGKSVLLGDKKSLIGQMTSDILSSRLVQAGPFLLFERTDPLPLLEALDAGHLSDMNLPAEYLIIGSLSEFGRNTTGESGIFSRTKVQKAYARVNLRLVDVRSGRVIYADEGAGEAETEAGTIFGVGSKAGYDSSLDAKAISAAISKLVSNLVENMMAQPWRSYVLARDGENLIIGGGASQGIAVGDRFALMKRGALVKNPQTGTEIELPGEQAALLEVVSLFGNTPETEGAVCKILSGGVPEGDDFSEYIVEEAQP